MDITSTYAAQYKAALPSGHDHDNDKGLADIAQQIKQIKTDEGLFINLTTTLNKEVTDVNRAISTTPVQENKKKGPSGLGSPAFA